ncbi:MAG: pyrroline-5-carboxylate reductase [Flavobacteriales bacterium]|nr:MAG: pyrroline-5-carboxylate reductase [Flavobacteriales bacterium]
MDSNKKIAIIGGGNLGASLAKGLVKSGKYQAKNITVTRRDLKSLDALSAAGFGISDNNAEAAEDSEIVVLAVLPQQFDAAIGQVKNALDAEKHLLISCVTGVSIKDIRDKTGSEIPVIRTMPNTAIAIGESMTCLSADESSKKYTQIAKEIFDTVGTTLVIPEEHMGAATALCACGVAFFLRAIRAASQGGIEIGFHADEALQMAAQTAKGAAALLLYSEKHPEREIDKVTSPEGCTIAGLNEMEHQGFSSALIKGITTSASKAEKLYKE